MKKTTILCLPTFLICCTIMLNPFRGVIDTRSNTYTSDSLKISLTPPTGWKMYQTHPLDSSLLFLFSEERDYRLLLGMTSEDHHAAARVLVTRDAALVRDVGAELNTRPEIGPMIAARWIISGTDSAALVEYLLLDSSSRQMRYREFLFARKAHTVRVQCFSLSSLFPDYEPMFTQLLREISCGDDGNGTWSAPWGESDFLTDAVPIDFMTVTSTTLPLNSYREVCRDSLHSTFWKIRSASNTVFILGSIHVAKPEIYPLKPAILSAFDSSDILVVEVDVQRLKSEELLKGYASVMFYPSDETAQNHVPGAVYGKLVSTLKRFKLPVSTFIRFQPWLLSLTLSQQQLTTMGITSEYGIDDHFLKKGSSRKMAILELETGKEQMDLLIESCNTPLFLEYTLNEIVLLEQYMVPLIGAWKCGNTDILEKLTYSESIEKHPEFQQFYKKLLFERNRKFARKIAEYLTDTRDYFVVFGCAHAVGAQGVISLLEAKGFKAEQL